MNVPAEKKQPWWKNAVIYQVYPRSFADTNGDGYGDIPGIISKLDYLADLGIDAIWLSPLFRSPQDDNGYDISDYRDVDPLFGTLEDMELLIEEGKKRGIRMIMDLVVNHSSDEHYWFQEAKKSRDNPYHDFYIWREKPTNDWISPFGGTAWEWVPEVEQYYLHQFSVKQPDLNWENPAMRREVYEMIRWWMDKGVGGFRLDVVDHFGKVPDEGILRAGPMLHTYLREMSRETFQKGDLVTVGEAWSADTESAKLYSNPDGSELSMVFQFEHMELDQQGSEKWDTAPLDLIKLKGIMNRWQTELNGCGWNSQFWENHDLPRIVSRWGNDREYRVESAKMLGILLFGFQGTPYIYQGQELGMTNAAYELEEYQDIETKTMYRRRLAKGYSHDEILKAIHVRSRDNARTPMQWTAGENAGFTDGKPWLRVNPNYPEINAESQIHDPDSIFSCYKTLVRLRKTNPVFADGAFELLLENHEDIFAYTRTNADSQILVVCNFHGKTIENPLADREASMELLISNYKEMSDLTQLRPYEARMYIKK